MRRLRLNVTGVDPGFVRCSLFQSDNGINWGCVATNVTFPESWWRSVFGVAETGVRYEIEFGVPMAVTE